MELLGLQTMLQQLIELTLHNLFYASGMGINFMSKMGD